MLTLDTNILIGYIGGESTVVERVKDWRAEDMLLFISSVAECELFSYSKLSLEEIEKIERFLAEHFIAIPFDGVRARKAAAIRRMVPVLKLPDAAIAALALDMNIPLVTRNVRDFKHIPELEIITI